MTRRAPRFATLSLALLAGAVAAPPSVADWPSFRGPHGNGVATDPLPSGDGPLGLELAWKRPLGSGYSGVAVVGDTLVTAFQAGHRDVVAAFDAGSGEERWRFDLSPTYVGHDGSHDGPIATPAVAGGRVFMTSATGRVVALDLGDGAELWSVDLVEDLACEPPYYGFASSPVVAGDTVVLQIPAEEGVIAGFDAASGELRWRAVDDGVMAQSPIVATLAGREQVLAIAGESVTGIDPADGSVLWTLAHGGSPGPFGNWTSSPLPIGGDRIFLKHEDPSTAVVAVTAEGGALAAAQLATSRGMTRSYSPATVADGTVYGFTARFLSAVDPGSGEILWRSRDVGDGFVISVDGHLVALTKTGSLHLGLASRESWSESARLELFDDALAWTPPSYSGGAVYARSHGELARIDVVRGPSRMAAGDAPELPAVLAELAARVARAESAGKAPAPVVDEFLAGRELPIVDGGEVVFLWRGDATDVAIAGDMIGMRREEAMHRLPGTDLWWWATELDRRARLSYLFFVDYEPTVDPAHDRVVRSTVLGPDMNWSRADGVDMSWFAMPEWPGWSAGQTTAADAETDSRPAGRVETFTVTVERTAPEGEEALEPIEVPVHAWLPPGYDDSDRRFPVVYVHHQAARGPGGWIETLERAVGRTVRPLIAVFPEMPRAPGMGGAFAGQIVPAVEARFRTADDRMARANVGMGWPGFQAAMQTLGAPELFGVLGVQSLFMLDEQMQALEAAVAEHDAEELPLRAYLEWGRWDLVSPHEQMNFRASSRWGWELLESKGWKPVGGEVWDSTDFASWRNRTEAMLQALFPAEGAPSALERWLTGAP